MKLPKGLPLFLLFNVLTCWFVFRSALWGERLLAPLDLPAALYHKYSFVDPHSSGVPSTVGMNDQLIYDLPLQYTIHDAYQRGEMPWWDPYSLAGRPLLADAHINGTDPIRLLIYPWMPFIWAYNYTKVCHFFLSGLGMFLLLHHFGFRWGTATLMGLTYEFCGCHAFFFGHPWIHASFLYYPYLWWVYDSAWRQRQWWHIPAASVLVAAVFYAGNLQSHAYLPLLMLALAAGYWGESRERWLRLLMLMAISGILGVLLAAPVLTGQLEFFLVGKRSVSASHSRLVWFCGLASLTSVYPWMLGTFRTFDLRNVVFQSVGLGQNYGLGYHTFVGSVAFCLAALNLRRTSRASRNPLRRTAWWLLGIFFVIMSTPLVTVLYGRSSGLAVLGLIVLAAAGLEELAENHERMARYGWSVIGVACLLGAVTNIGSLVIYPRLMPHIRERVKARDASDLDILRVGNAVREFQLRNLPNEISFKNKEPALAFLGLLWLGFLALRPDLRRWRGTIPSLALLNLLPVIFYCQRFLPNEPVALWQRLIEGGPEQQRAVAALQPGNLRLWESAPKRPDFLFPDAFQNFYRVRTVQGYSALVPKCLFTMSLEEQQQHRAQLADYTYVSAAAGQKTGVLARAAVPIPVRFQWLDDTRQSLSTEEIRLNQIVIHLPEGKGGNLLWTDTQYPGWHASNENGPIALRGYPPCFNRIEIPPGTRRVILEYRPSFLNLGLGLAAMALAGLLGISWFERHYTQSAGPGPPG